MNKVSLHAEFEGGGGGGGGKLDVSMGYFGQKSRKTKKVKRKTQVRTRFSGTEKARLQLISSLSNVLKPK